MLEVQSLTRAYGRHVVVDGVSFEVAPGDILALLGPNGVGKSTTMRVLAGVLPPTSGHYRVNGIDGRSEEARRMTGYVPDTRGLFPRLTVAEHVALSARLARATQWSDRADELVSRLGLAQVRDAPAATLSHGQSRRLSVAMALVSSPRLLLIDEPFDGVDPLGVDVITGLLEEERARGAAMVLTTHLLDAAQMSDEVAIFTGRGLHGPTRTRDLLDRHGSLKAAWAALAA